MLDTLAKNLWLLITVGIPGMFTYGVWRVLLLLEPSNCLDTEALKQIDGSAIASASIVIAIGLLQQAVGISIESLLAFLAKSGRKNGPICILCFVNVLSWRRQESLMKMQHALSATSFNQ